MLIADVANSGAIPTLSFALSFAARRQTILAHNIANIDTPNFQPMDVSTSDFQKVLGEAIDSRRARTGGEHGPLEWQETRELRHGPGGSLRLRPQTAGGGILFHDRNNRDLERMMQDLAENVGVFRVVTDLLRSQFSQIKDAIAERV